MRAATVGVWVLGLALAGAGCGQGAGAPERWVAAGIGLDFVRIPAGEFVMGSPVDEPGREAQELAHAVTLSRDFYLATTEVTQAQWERVMGANPSAFSDCPGCPVETISALDVEAFLDLASELEGVRFRLPTEAEWEYACRAGNASIFGVGEVLTTRDANYDGNYPLPRQPSGEFRGRPTPVGSFAANAFGLYDMNGNVWEWTSDRHCEYSPGDVMDPAGECSSGLRVIRGGSWLFGADSARCALRYTHRPQDDGPSLGLRLARDAEGGAG